jgi:hypothetical protein
VSACSPSQWKAADRATFGAALAVTTCDWGATRSAAVGGWRDDNVESNPVIGPKPDRATVDGYFATVAAAEIMAWLVTPPRYRTLVFGVVTALELGSAVNNRGTIGLCGVFNPE